MIKLITAEPDRLSIEEKMYLDENYINLYLNDPDLTLQDIFQLIMQTGVAVKSIQVDSFHGSNALFEDIGKSGALESALLLTDMLVSSAPIPVICQTNLGASVLNKPEMLYSLKNEVNEALDTYQNASLYVKNSMIFHPLSKTISQGALPEYSEVVRILKNEIKHDDRLFAAIDTGHVFASIHTIKKIYPKWSIRMEDYFAKASDVCRMVQITNSIELGVTPYTHSVGFSISSNEDKMRLNNILKYAEEYLDDYIINVKMDDHTELLNTLECLRSFGIE